MVIVIGGLVQYKLKNPKMSKSKEYENNWDSNTSSEFKENPTIKKYILDYKSQYSKDSILTALKNNGYKEEDIQAHLEKFY